MFRKNSYSVYNFSRYPPTHGAVTEHMVYSDKLSALSLYLTYLLNTASFYSVPVGFVLYRQLVRPVQRGGQP